MEKSQSKVRIFISKKERSWINQGGQKNNKKTISSLLNCTNIYLSPYCCYPWPATPEDEARLLKYLNAKETGNHGIDNIVDWQRDIERKKKAEKEERAEKLNNEKLEGCPEEIPDWFHDYIRKVVIPEDTVILYSKKSRGKQKGRCMCCGHEMVLYGKGFHMWGYEYCPNCGTRCMTLSKTSRARQRERLPNVALLQRGADGSIWIRQFHLWRDDTIKWENLSEFLEEFGRIRLEESAVYAFRNEGKYGMANHVYAFSDWERVSGCGVYDGSYYFCMDNIEDIFAGTRFQYSDLRGYMERRERTNPISYLQNFARYPSMEYLEKLGYIQIVDAKVNSQFRKDELKVFNFKGKSLTEVLKIDKSTLKLIDPADLYINSAEILQMGSKFNFRIEDTCRLLSLKADSGQLENMLRFVKPTKLVEYIEVLAVENDRTKSMIVTEYSDYISDCEVLGYDLTNTQILYPKNFNEAHQKAAELRVAKENGDLDNKVKARYDKQLKKLMYRDKESGLFIRPIKSYGELVVEGKMLSHCVGTYGEKVASGRISILVIRKISEPDKPYYTLEYQGGHVTQCRGKWNCGMTEDIKAFVEKWTKKKLKKVRTRISA